MDRRWGCPRHLLCAGCGLRDIDLRPSATVLVDGAQTSIFTMKKLSFLANPSPGRSAGRSPNLLTKVLQLGCPNQLPPASSSCFLAASRRAQPRFPSQDSSGKIAQPRLLSQDSSAKDSSARIPQPRFLSQDSSAKIPQPRFLSQDSTVKIPQARFLSQDSSAKIPQPNCPTQIREHGESQPEIDSATFMRLQTW